MASAATLELQRIFTLATGTTLSIETGNQAYEKTAKYISLGENEYATDAGVAYNGGLQDGYEVVTKGNSLFITGGSNYGALYGVYGLMNELFDYEYYYKDTETYSQRTKLYLDEISSLSGEPDFARRAAGYGTMWAENDVYNPNRYGVKIYTNYFAPVGGQVFHNALEYAPYETYGDAHSSWYASTKTQLCYTANGNSTEYQALVDTVVAAMTRAISANRDKQYIALMGEDNHDVCACGSCTYYKNYYGSDSAALILFINEVNGKIRSWIAEEKVDTDIQICILAYLGYYQAPTKNVNQLQLADGVSVLIAPIEIEYNKPFTNDTKKNFEGWKALTDNIGFWVYNEIWGENAGVLSEFIPFDSFTGMQERYQYMHSLGAEYIFSQGHSETYGLQSGFKNLKMYLISKLAWDTTANVSVLTENFFNAFYGEAASSMKSMYEDMLAYMQALPQQGATGQPYGSWNDMDFWAKEDIWRWKGYIDNALQAIVPLQATDSASYTKYYNHIVAERISLNYMLLKFYGEGSYDELKSDIVASGIQSGGRSGETLYNYLINGQ